MTEPSAVQAPRKKPPTWVGMVKVQRSLSPRDTRVLFTSRDGMIHSELPMSADLLRWFEDGELKFYARASLRNEQLHIIRKHEGHAW